MKPEILKADFKQALESPEVLELWIYSEVAPDGYNWWTEEPIPSETSANFFRDKLAQYPDVAEIRIYINSCGGSVKEGYGIYSQLKRHPAKKTVYVDGFANSIASIIAMAGDHIVMSMGSMMGIHNMMDYLFGNASEHRKIAEDLDRMMEGNRQIYLQRSGGKITLEKLTELLDAETMLTAQECLEYGFCDEIVGNVTNPEGVAQMMQRMNTGIAQQAKYFGQLKQCFAQAMEAGAEKAPENKPMKFLCALMRREETR
jgi:ATP-dependent Clp protease protease subunit